MIQQYYCKEKSDADHSQDLKGYWAVQAKVRSLQLQIMPRCAWHFKRSEPIMYLSNHACSMKWFNPVDQTLLWYHQGESCLAVAFDKSFAFSVIFQVKSHWMLSHLMTFLS